MERLRQLIHEIHRRSLWQVLGIYLLASWAVLQVVDTLGGALRLPEWLEPVALVLLIVGLPIVLATAFVQEGGPRRGAGDVQVAAPPGGAVGLFTWRNAFGGGVLAFALLGFVGTGWILFGGGLRTSEAPAPFEQSVAVMPCTDGSTSGDQTPLTQGFAEGIINGLAMLPDLKVIGVTSVIALLEENADIETIARRLNVSTVLECDLQQVGETVRVRSRLVEAATGAVLWSEAIDGPATNIFAIQDAVARAVTDELQVTLAGGAETRLVVQGTAVPEAYQAYRRGRFFWNQRTEVSLRNAITEFERAVDLDPSYAEAYSGLADSYFSVDGYAVGLESLDYRTNFEQGITAARRAVSLAPELGMAHASLGFGLWNVGEWEGAERELRLAIELSPGYATAHLWYGISLFTTGRAIEGVSHSERALALDPVSQVISLNVGWALWSAGRTEDAIEQYRETIQLAPGWPVGWFALAVELLYVGEYDEGLEAWVKSYPPLNLDVQAAREAYGAMTRYRATGEPQTFSETGASKGHLVWLYAQTGQPDRAIESFDDYYVGQGAYGLGALVHVLYASDPLGDDPRYQALLEEAGITW